MGSGPNLQESRFADDLLLIGKTSREVELMLRSLAAVAAKAGLQVHPVQTKISSNTSKRQGLNARTKRHFEFGSDDVLEIDERAGYLGRLLGFTDSHDAEMDHRIAKALAVFTSSRAGNIN